MNRKDCTRLGAKILALPLNLCRLRPGAVIFTVYNIRVASNVHRAPEKPHPYPALKILRHYGLPQSQSGVKKLDTSRRLLTGDFKDLPLADVGIQLAVVAAETLLFLMLLTN